MITIYNKCLKKDEAKQTNVMGKSHIIIARKKNFFLTIEPPLNSKFYYSLPMKEIRQSFLFRTVVRSVVMVMLTFRKYYLCIRMSFYYLENMLGRLIYIDRK